MSDYQQPDVLLLDMGNTFMFGCDRFSGSDGLEHTYRGIGGTRLSDIRVREVIHETLTCMGRMYATPSYFDSFPTVRGVLVRCATAEELGQEDLDHLEEVFARHEVGAISERYVTILEQLAGRFRLGVISNVWAPSRIFRDAFARANVLDLFQTVVFSSDHGCIKPSAKLFQRALQEMDASPDRTWYVGDDLRCDVGGAQGVGLKAVWINPYAEQIGENDPVPDLVIRDLGDLLVDQRQNELVD